MSESTDRVLGEINEVLAASAALSRREELCDRNRRNAQRSTGPRTAEGKAAVAGNALKHGLRAADPLALPGSDPFEAAVQARALQKMTDQLRTDLCPCGPTEEILFQRVVTTAWRLRRLPIAEQFMIRRHREKQKRAWEREMLNTRPKLRAPIDERELRASALLANSFDWPDADNRHARLQRYEASAERSFYRALDTLRKAQLARRKMNEQSHSARANPDATLVSDDVYDNRNLTTAPEQSHEQSH